jgi:hypothetical protein
MDRVRLGLKPPGYGATPAEQATVPYSARFSERCDVAPPVHGGVVIAKPQKILEPVNRNLTALYDRIERTLLHESYSSRDWWHG